MRMTQQFFADLDALLSQHGLTRKMQRGELTIVDDNAKAVAFGYEARHLGLEASDFGAIVTLQGRQFKIIGAKSSRPKYPLDGEDINTGTVYKLPRSVVPQIIALRKQANTPHSDQFSDALQCYR